MGTFGCCVWWFLFGGLLGWLANWLLGCKCGGMGAASSAVAPGVGPSADGMTFSSSSSPAPDSALHRLINTRFYHEYHGDAGDTSAPVAAQTLLASAPSAVAGIDVAAARAAGLSLKGPDDLTVVEGIGPKIAEILRARGITTFTALAAMSASGLQAILDAAGPNFKLAVPQTWPEQAALAAQNRWAELKALQDRLVVGVRPTE
jgi:predicted flap endonuclease-1-like 5' DNA nuclease/uncharacterized membrane protein YeaQ/YmgE (transglycosylase-associated protein family)